MLRYIRLILKRERLGSLIWLLGMVGCIVGFAPLYVNLFSTPEELHAIAMTVNAPAMIALIGPVFGLDSLTPAMVMAQQALFLFIAAIAVMNVFFVVRHTRADEELGRMEVLRSLPIGRLTSAIATLAGAAMLNLGISLLSFLGLVALKVEGTTIAGAFVYCFAIGISGLFFAGLALLMCQLLSSSRGAATGFFAMFGLFFMLRAMGDVQESWLSWVSPLGIPLQVYAFYDNNFFPIVLMLILTAIVAAGALWVCQRRDLGEGVIPARRGKGEASRLLLNPLGFAWRLSRGSFVGWSVAVSLFGAMYGAVLMMDDFLEIEMLQALLETLGDTGNLLHGFVSMLFLIMSLLAAVPVISCFKRLRGEEKHHRLEQLYARSVCRTKMMLSFLAVAVLFSVAMPLLSGLGMYAASVGATGLSLGEFMQAAMSYVPAIWATLGLCALLVGLLPKLTSLAWVYFGFTFFFNYIGRLALPEEAAEFAAQLTPFGWIAQLPVQEFRWAPLIALTGIAVALCAAGLWGYRRRDIGRT